jgi:hypothetical protein
MSSNKETSKKIKYFVRIYTDSSWTHCFLNSSQLEGHLVSQFHTDKQWGRRSLRRPMKKQHENATGHMV